jgi:hypothetical protein
LDIVLPLRRARVSHGGVMASGLSGICAASIIGSLPCMFLKDYLLII